MSSIPRDNSPDSTLALAFDGYRFISRRCRRYRSDAFATRILMTPTVCMTGAAAAEFFYGEARFTRKGAAPGIVRKTLFGRKGIQGLDGDMHRSRKQMFMALMTPEAIERLCAMVAEEWRDSILEWETKRQVVLLDAAREILCRAVCRWAGVPLAESEARQRAEDFGAMIEGAGSIGARHWRGRAARRRANRWIGAWIEDVRSGRLEPDAGSAIHRIAWHRDPDGKLLDAHTAAVELINVLRPTVAIDRFISYAALALFAYPACRRKIESGEDGYPENFVQEVRRFYPFFPFIGAVVKEPFEWREIRFFRGMQVLLDLYGTNHDERIWKNPYRFSPDRFREWDGSPFNFIPQGGGDHYVNHRCAGEWITIAVMKTAVGLLLGAMAYDVPEQDLSIRLSRVPARPKSGFVIARVRKIS